MVLTLTRGSPPGGGAAGPHTHPESDIVPDSILARVADPETWASLQTLNAGLRLAGGSIEDSGGTSRIRLATTSPHVTISGDARLGGHLALPNVNPLSDVYLLVRNTGAVDSVTGLTVDLGSSTSSATNVVQGVAGRAVAKHPDTVQAVGLDYVAGMVYQSISHAIGARTAHLATGSGYTITNAYGFYANDPNVILGTITNLYGFYAPNLTGATNRYAAQFDGPTPGVPLFRVLSGVNPGNNQTNLFLAENTLGTITLRRVEWKRRGQLGLNDRVLILV